MAHILLPPLHYHFFNLLGNSKKSILLVAPYIKIKIVQQIIGTLNKSGTLNKINFHLITNVNTSDFLSRSSDIEALELLFKFVPNMKITGIGNLHAKCYIFDQETIIISSGNLTPSGMSNNIELSIVMDEKSEAIKLSAVLTDNYASLGTSINAKQVSQLKEEIDIFLKTNNEELASYTSLISAKNNELTRFKSKSILVDAGDSVQYAELFEDVEITKTHRVPIIKVKNELQHPFETFKSDDEWHIFFDQLVDFRNRNPDKWPTSKYHSSGWELAQWSDRQRELRVMQKLAPSYQRELDMIGFEFSKSEAAWQYGLAHLKWFIEENNGDLPFTDERPSGFRLGEWIIDNRTAAREKKLTPHKINLLTEAGMIWDEEQAEWKSLIRLIRLYRLKKPDRWPMRNEKIKGHQLYPLLRQLSQRKHELTLEQLNDLKKLNFPINNYHTVSTEAEWIYNYKHAQQFLDSEGKLPSKSHSTFLGRRTAKWLDIQIKDVKKHPNSYKRRYLEAIGIKFYSQHDNPL